MEAGCNGSVIQRPKALVEPLDGSKFWRNLLRLNKCRSRKVRCLKNQHSAFFKHIERSSLTVATLDGSIQLGEKPDLRKILFAVSIEK